MPIIRNGPTPGVRFDSVGLTSGHTRPDPSKQACTKLIGQQTATPVLLVQLIEGTTLRVNRSLQPDPTTRTIALNLTSGEVASITDWTNLRIRLIADYQPGSIRVTDVYLEAPGAAVAVAGQTANAAVATSSWVANNPAPTEAATATAAVATSTWVARNPAPTTAATASPAVATSSWVAVNPSATAAATGTPAAAVSSWVTRPPAPTVGGVTASPAVAISTWTARNPVPTAVVLFVGLYEGATLRASRSVGPTSTVGTTALNLTSGELASITDWTNLRVRLTATAPSGRIRVTDLYLEAPGAAVAVTRIPAAAVSTWVARDASTSAPGGAQTGNPAVAISSWVTRAPTTNVSVPPAPAVLTWVTRDPSTVVPGGPQTANAVVAISTWVVRSPTVVVPSTAIDPWFPGRGEVTFYPRRREEPRKERKKHRHPLRIPKALRPAILEVLPPLVIPPLPQVQQPPALPAPAWIDASQVQPPLPEPVQAQAPMAVAEPEARPAHWSEYAHLPYTAEDENEELQVILAAVLKR